MTDLPSGYKPGALNSVINKCFEVPASDSGTPVVVFVSHAVPSGYYQAVIKRWGLR